MKKYPRTNEEKEENNEGEQIKNINTSGNRKNNSVYKIKESLKSKMAESKIRNWKKYNRCENIKRREIKENEKLLDKKKTGKRRKFAQKQQLISIMQK